jgi:hypothetical protein
VTLTTGFVVLFELPVGVVGGVSLLQDCNKTKMEQSVKQYNFIGQLFDALTKCKLKSLIDETKNSMYCEKYFLDNNLH